MTVRLTAPVFPPKQLTFVTEKVAPRVVAGWVIVTFEEVVQPRASVTITVYEPAIRPVAVAVV